MLYTFSFMILSLLSSLSQAQGLESISPKAPINEFPILGLGTWGLGLNGKAKNASDAIAGAIEVGYRNFDTAARYDNQKLLAPGFKEGLRRTGLKREDIWVTSKLWTDRSVRFLFFFLSVDKELDGKRLYENKADVYFFAFTRHGDKCEQALKETLNELQMEYLDLYLMHFPVGEGGVFDHIKVSSRITFDPFSITLAKLG